MAAAPNRAYADSQIGKIADKIAKLDAKDKASPARKARLIAASKKWQRLSARAQSARAPSAREG
ncbi:MAG: hypothetical protein ACT4N4_11415 [Rhodospirillales bacterium]